MEHIQNWQECLCCTELEGCMQSLESEEVKADLEVDAHCITEHPSFTDVCLRKWILSLAADKYKDRRGKKYDKSGKELISNKFT